MGNYAGYAAAAVSIGSSVLGGQAEKKAGKRAAKAEMAAARDEARLIRKLAKEARSAATAAYAGSGIDVSEGTPLIAEREITQAAEQDALTTLLSGKRGASAYRAGGSVAATAGFLEGAGTALYASSSWRRSRPVSSGGGP